MVRRRRWLTRDEFLDLLGATNLIPGPNSTELAIHIGHRRAGWPGLLVAGTCFILPAVVIVTAIAWAYVRFGQLPKAEGLLYGVKPVIIAVVVQALWGLGRSALKTRALAVVGRRGGGVVLPGCQRTGDPFRNRTGFCRGANVQGRQANWRSSALARYRAGAAGGRRDEFSGGRGHVVRSLADVPVLPQGRLGPVRQRLCPAGIPAGGPGGALALAYGGAIARRHRRRPVHAGAGVHHGDVHRLPAGGLSRRDAGHDRHLFCRHSSSWRSAGRSCRDCGARRSPAPSWTG